MVTERVVPVVVRSSDGTRVRVGQALVTEAEVVLSLEPMSLQLEDEVAAPKSATSGNRLADLEWLAQRSRKLLEDPRKQRWHADTRSQLAMIEAEMDRLRQRDAH
jgi:hypothetical protein